MDGLRSEGLLDSAIAAPFQTFDGIDLYPSVQQKRQDSLLAWLAIILFLDGNKRIGAHSMLVFLVLNEIRLDYTQEELISLFMKVASGECGYEVILNWIYIHQTEE